MEGNTNLHSWHTTSLSGNRISCICERLRSILNCWKQIFCWPRNCFSRLNSNIYLFILSSKKYEKWINKIEDNIKKGNEWNEWKKRVTSLRALSRVESMFVKEKVEVGEVEVEEVVEEEEVLKSLSELRKLASKSSSFPAILEFIYLFIYLFIS